MLCMGRMTLRRPIVIPSVPPVIVTMTVIAIRTAFSMSLTKSVYMRMTDITTGSGIMVITCSVILVIHSLCMAYLTYAVIGRVSVCIGLCTFPVKKLYLPVCTVNIYGIADILTIHCCKGSRR